MSKLGRGCRAAISLTLAMLLTQGALTSTALAQGKELVVFAAASLKPALDAINERCERDTARKVSVSYAASSALAKQIASGARFNLLTNELVLIAPADSGVSVKIVGTFPDDTCPPIIHPAAIAASSSDPDAAASLAYLQAPAARSA